MLYLLKTDFTLIALHRCEQIRIADQLVFDFSFELIETFFDLHLHLSVWISIAKLRLGFCHSHRFDGLDLFTVACKINSSSLSRYARSCLFNHAIIGSA